MKAVTQWFERIFGEGEESCPPSPGLYHFRVEHPEEQVRIHLRVDPDGSGVLIVNADWMVHLNPTAVWMARDYLTGRQKTGTITAMSGTYQIAKDRLASDYTALTTQLDEIIRPDGACPIHDLNLETTLPFSAEVSAPYRMDLALTYRCNNDCAHCYNARTRDFAEMDTHDWQKALDHVWDLAIPHVVFTGGEPTLRNDLPELIAYAEKKGLITGLNTNGRRLSDLAYVHTLVDAGLDHVQITLESQNAAIHDRMVGSRGAWKQTVAGIQNAIANKLFVMTNTTLLQDNTPYIDQTLNFLAEIGVPTVGLNSLIYSGKGIQVGRGLRETQLPAILQLAQEHARATGQKLIWYTPTEYCHFDPVSHDLGIKGCTAAYYNMCLEPNGDVLPCQSYYRTLGNFLSDPWEKIWRHPLALELRERRNLPEKCTGCALKVECGGGCPLHRDPEALQPAAILQFMVEG